MRTVFSVAIELREKLIVSCRRRCEAGAETYYRGSDSWSLKWSRERWRSVGAEANVSAGVGHRTSARYLSAAKTRLSSGRESRKSHAASSASSSCL